MASPASPVLKSAPPKCSQRRTGETGRRRDAKTVLIRIWQSEIDLSDVFCTCSGPEEGLDKEGNETPPGTCPRCGATLESQESGSKGLKKAITTIFKRQQKSDAPEDGLDSGIRHRASLKDTAPGNDSTPAPETEQTVFQLVRQSLMPPPRCPTTATSGTRMYETFRSATGTGGNEASESTSVSSLLGGLGDDGVGRAKPKLTIDDTAARLRRAQKLLRTQARG